MPRIVFVEHSGKTHVVVGLAGDSLMEAAVKNSVPGVLADCGGSCSCGTCHGYVDPEWLSRISAPEVAELGMLDGIMLCKSNSRLTCQVKITDELDGLVVRLPESQF